MKAVRLRLVDNYGQLRRAIPSRQKSPPFVPHGLHGLFVGFRTINPSVVFFLSHFLQKAKKTFARKFIPI
jgi:hypothetical protein